MEENLRANESSLSKMFVADSGKHPTSDVTMLNQLMLFERHRRETLGQRNRRLLGKTKSSRILEEQNTALVRRHLRLRVRFPMTRIVSSSVTR